MWEIFENRETKQSEVRELVCKALLRRMAAQRGLGLYAGAAEDAKIALSIKPDGTLNCYRQSLCCLSRFG